MGISNSGAITALTNSGTISGDIGGTSSAPVGDAIYSAGSIGSITNSGKIIGTVEIDNQSSVIVHGGTGKTFGILSPGVDSGREIIIGESKLDFASG